MRDRIIRVGILCLSCVAAACAIPDRAAVEGDTPSSFGPQAGDYELALAGGGSNDEKFDAGGVRLSGAVGYYPRQQWLLALRQDLAFEDNGGDRSSGSTRVALDRVVSFDRLHPFFGVGLSFAYGESVNETLALAPELGAKLYLREKTFVQVVGAFQVFFTKTEDSTENLRAGEWLYSFGMGTHF